MIKRIRLLEIKVACLLLLQLFVTSSTRQVLWPADQLLPSFPSPAQIQDLITLRENSSYSSAEMYLFASLKGLVNKTKPRIFSYEFYGMLARRMALCGKRFEVCYCNESQK